jgi:hypothetical protein
MDLSSKSCVVLDHSMFLELALRLSHDVGKVYYVDPTWEQARSKIDHAITGDGFDGEVERVKEIWDVIEKVDFAVFPDTYHGGMQDIIERKLQVPVWGGRHADDFEIMKLAFRKIQQNLGMNVPEYDVVNGLEALREYCQDPKNEDRWIKLTPQFRGNRETFHHTTYEQTRSKIDEMGVEFDIVQDVLTFLCEKSIQAKLEGGLDTYTVDGQHPSVAVQGYEAKDQCYFAVVQHYDDIPEEIRSVNEYLWPLLKEKRCRQFLSTEVKITDDGKSFLLEPTIRLPSPAGEEQMELYENISEIIYQGAQGILVDPVVKVHFACEAMVEHKGNKDRWRSLQVPDSVRRWIKLYDTVKVGDTLGIAPGSECIGAVVGIGNTPQEALDHLKENAEAISDQDVTIHIESLATILQEIEEAQSKGIEFTDKPMPDPTEAITT